MRLLLLLMLLACDPVVTGARNVNVDPTPEQLAAHEKMLAERKAAKEAVIAAEIAEMERQRRNKLNVNTATRVELLHQVEGVDEVVAEAIESFRPFESIEQFRYNLLSVTDGDFISLFERFIYVPIQYDKCDGPTLMQIPGLTEEEAILLIEGRPYGSVEAFMAKLAEFTSEDDREIGLRLLESP